MGATEFKKMENYSETIWMVGKRNPDNSYFYCEFLDRMYRDPEEPEKRILFCKKFEKKLTDKSDCTMDCEIYGRCDFCNGFSAIGCQVCEIPRPD